MKRNLKRHFKFRVLTMALVTGFSCFASAAKVEVKETGETTQGATDTDRPKNVRIGKDAAREQFSETSSASSVVGSEAHYLSLNIGSFVSSDSWKWGAQDKTSDAGKFMVGVSYRLGEWLHSMDLLFRGDLQTFELPEDRATKLSFTPAVTFPDASSKFPLYFGGAAGLGFFLKQLHDESALSLDYQLFAGARFFNLFGTTGLLVEGGVKNHFHLLSDGQFNGVYLTVGTVFVF